MSRALRRTYTGPAGSLGAELRLDDGERGGAEREERRLRGTVGDGAEDLAVDVAVRRLDEHRILVRRGDELVRATVVREGETAWVAIEGHTYELTLEEEGARGAHAVAEEDFALSPMTGTLAKMSVAAGDDVARGGELFVVEAMKMEYVVRAPRDVTIAAVKGEAGDAVEQGAIVVTYEGEA